MEKLGYVRLASPWLLSVIPALAYVIAYLNRLGEAYAHRIPVDWISVSLTDALSRTSAVVLVVGLLIAIARAGTQWTKRLPLWMRRAAVKAVDQLGPVVLYGFILGSLPLLFFFMGISVLSILSTAARDLIRRDSLEPLPKSNSKPGGVVLLDRTEPGDLADVQIRATRVLVAVVLSLLLAMFVGYSRASMQTAALVTPDSSRIVAASYTGTVVLADLEVEPDGSWHVGDSRQMVTLGQGLEQAYVLRRAPSSISW